MKSLEDISWSFVPDRDDWHVTDRRKRWERSPKEYPLTKCTAGLVDNCGGILRSTSFDWHTRSPREWLRMNGSEDSSPSLLHYNTEPICKQTGFPGCLSMWLISFEWSWCKFSWWRRYFWKDLLSWFEEYERKRRFIQSFDGEYLFSFLGLPKRHWRIEINKSQKSSVGVHIFFEKKGNIQRVSFYFYWPVPTDRRKWQSQVICMFTQIGFLTRNGLSLANSWKRNHETCRVASKEAALCPSVPIQTDAVLRRLARTTLTTRKKLHLKQSHSTDSFLNNLLLRGNQ